MTTVAMSTVRKRDDPPAEGESEDEATKNKRQKKQLEASPSPELLGVGDGIMVDVN